MHIPLATFSILRFGLPLLRLDLLDPKKIFLKGLGGTRVIADFIPSIRLGYVDVFVPVGEFEQNITDFAHRY